MIPFSDFHYFGLLLYILVPTLALGMFGRANRAWTLLATLLVGILNFSDIRYPYSKKFLLINTVVLD